MRKKMTKRRERGMGWGWQVGEGGGEDGEDKTGMKKERVRRKRKWEERRKVI